MITPEELKRIDMPESSLKVKHPETGVEGYRVGLEVFHQLHCINLLRQVTYKDYYMELGNGNFAGGEEELQMHTGMPCNAHSGTMVDLSRSLPRNSSIEYPMQRRYWRLHFLHARRRPTSMARTRLMAHLPKLRCSARLGIGELGWQHGKTRYPPKLISDGPGVRRRYTNGTFNLIYPINSECFESNMIFSSICAVL
jgi:hypothetical protein